MNKSIFILGILILISGTSQSAKAIGYSIDVTYTADNMIGAWYIADDETELMKTGANAYSWWNTDTATVDGLMFGTTYWLGWTLQNGDGVAGFLAMIDSSESLITDSRVSSSSWEVSKNGKVWVNATEYGAYNSEPWKDGTWIGGDLSAFEGTGANWIWDDKIKDRQTIYVRTQFSASAPVPEPATILLFGIGLTGLVGLKRHTFKN